jgi:DNA-binding MarR family transcriptional regulator
VIVTTGEDVRAGRYGNFTFVVSSEDEATRSVVKDIASAQHLAIFVSSSPKRLEEAEAAGDLTVTERETLTLVLRAGGTVTAAEFAGRLGVEQTTAGNRLVALHKKGYLQRIERPHPFGDQFIDPRSVRFDLQPVKVASALSPEGSALTQDIISRYKGALNALARNERKARQR